MFDVLRNVFRQLMAEQGEHASETEVIHLAMAALLCEVSKADYEAHPQEKTVKVRLLQQLFALNETEASQLLKRAEQKSNQAVSLFDMTDALRSLSQSERFRLLESMWMVAYADGRIDPQEEALIRQVADLIYVDHNDFIRAKLAAEQASQERDEGSSSHSYHTEPDLP